MMQILLTLILVYLSIGFIFAIAFVAVGYRKIDQSAQETRLRLRLLWMPGSIAVWPALAVKWKRAKLLSENT